MLCLGPEANTKPVKLIEQCENCAGQCGAWAAKAAQNFHLLLMMMMVMLWVLIVRAARAEGGQLLKIILISPALSLIFTGQPEILGVSYPPGVTKIPCLEYRSCDIVTILDNLWKKSTLSSVGIFYWVEWS